jgi:prephenate dehydrogenase
MPHILSNAFIKSPTALKHKGFSAGSYKDLTRVAWLNAPMWSELLLENRQHILKELDLYIHSLNEYRNAIANHDLDFLTRLLEDGKRKKEEVDG